MKFYTLIITLFLTQNLFAQGDLLKKMQTTESPDKGQLICTELYWNAERDGGKEIFIKMARYFKQESVEFKVSKEQKEKGRAVLTIDFLRDGVKRDEVYLFAIQDKGNRGKWLIDGFNESKLMITPFLEGKCSGHFWPLDLPNDASLTKLAEGVLGQLENVDGLNEYLKEKLGEQIEYYSIITQLRDNNFDKVVVFKTGYSEEMERGYIYYEHQISGEESYMYGQTTIYLKKNKEGNYEAFDYGFGKPSSRYFFK